MNLKEIKELLQLMMDHSLTEIEIEKDGTKIKLRKDSGGPYVTENAGGAPSATIPFSKSAKFPSSETAPASVSEESQNVVVVRAPMVGTFYASPAPDQPPYISAGQTVREGDVLCIIEAMKLMNEIKCEVAGTITEILIQNGQAVEFDQPLFKVKKL